MSKTRTLNLVDIMTLKKDLLWGKEYYGLFEKGKLVDSILFSNAYNNKKVIEVHSIESKNRDFLNKFTEEFARKKKIRYFVRELDESTQVSDIEFMQACGFKRYNRNYCFEYIGDQNDLKENAGLRIFCREMERYDLVKIMDLDISTQILEYRDYLHKSKSYLKDSLDDIYVFVDSNNMESMCGFAFKRNLEQGSTFEFVIHPRQAEAVFACVGAFAEKYVHFEKNSESFRFIVNENLNPVIADLKKDYDLLYSSQLLIYEGAPRDKVEAPAQGIALGKAPASG